MALRHGGDARWLRGKAVVLAMLLVGVIFILDVPPARSEPASETGASGDVAKEAARKAIPWNRLSKQDQRIAQYLVKNHSVFRRMPTRVVPCDPQMFTFLAQRPEVVASIWKTMGISQLDLKRTSPTTFQAADNAGTSGALRVMHAEWGADARNRVVLYAQGTYEAKPLPRPIKAHCLLVLHSASRVESDGRPYVTTRLDSFIYFDRTAADLVAKTISPLINRTADHNFTETMKFVSTFSQTTQRNPDGVVRLASRLENLDEQVREDLIAMCQESASRAPRAAIAKSADTRR